MTLLLSLFGDQVWFKEMHMRAKLTRDELVIINFICHLSWAIMPKCLVKHSGCFYEGIFWMKLTFK